MKPIAIITTMLLSASLLATACQPKSRRAEIEQRKAAIQQKRDSMLWALQRELAWVDSALLATSNNYDALQKQLSAGGHSKAELRQLSDDLTSTRQHRDSLQVLFDLLCGQIKYIHRKQRDSL